MKKYFNSWSILSLLVLVLFASCTSDATSESSANSETATASGEVNVYTHRHYDTDKKLFADFEKQTGIKVNVVKANADELMTRLETEGANSPADLLITVDAGRLYRAKSKNLLQGVSTATLEANVPAKYRDEDGTWYGLTKRARIAVYAKDRVKREELSTYSNLTDEAWKGRVLVRSSGNIYNQSLLASLIATSGEDAAKNWAAGMVNNFARPPKGNDRDQVKAIAQGLGDVAIVNTYYIGKLLNSDDEEEQKAGDAVGIAFLTDETGGTHINVSGIGVTKHSPNKENAIKLIEFLTGKEAQMEFASANSEYPIHPEVPPSALLKSWGNFEEQKVALFELSAQNTAAVRIFDEVGWK